MRRWLNKFFGGGPTPPGNENVTVVASNISGRGLSGKPGSTESQTSSPVQDVGPANGSGDWAPGHDLLDEFVIERSLGEGGMGQVYLLRSRSSGSHFAVKRVKGATETERRNFLNELQTWIDLPEHVNLVPCHFFRSLGDDILIFAKYVEGGSLKDWIDSKRLYGDDAKQALGRLLDVSIQFAWGLHCLHELGLVHQDVKPGNLLLNCDQTTPVPSVIACVTDFGLARGRAAAGEPLRSDLANGVLVSIGGGTPAYWSPELAQGLALTHKTDIWSWGVSVLEMFTGGVIWMTGQAAPEALEQFLLHGAQDARIPAMPDGLANLLRRCFQPHPEERFDSLAKAVQELQSLYKDSVGAEYARALGPIQKPRNPGGKVHQRGQWGDPREWLKTALLAVGRAPAEVEELVSRLGVSRRGYLVGELAMLEEAKHLFGAFVKGGRVNLKSDLAKICMDKALVLRTAGDANGAALEYREAIALLKTPANQEGQQELANTLARACVNGAIALREIGDHAAAMELYDKAISIRELLAIHNENTELRGDLALTYMNKANAARDMGDGRTALMLYDKAIALWELLFQRNAADEFAHALARASMNKANIVGDFGDNRGAMALYDRAIRIFENLVNQKQHSGMANDLAMAYMNKAIAIFGLGAIPADAACYAIVLYDKAIRIQERLINEEGSRELANDLAMTYMNKGIGIGALGDHKGAVSVYDQAIAIRERLVNVEGRLELANDLAIAYTNKAAAVSDLGDTHAALALYGQAIGIRERLVNREGRKELVGDLAKLIGYRGDALASLGERTKGLQDMRSARATLHTEITRTGRNDLKHALTWLEGQLTMHSK